MLTTTASARNPKEALRGRMTGFVALCLTLLLAASASRLSASEGVDNVAQLLQSGVGESVVLAYIENSQVAYQPTAEEIVYLKDIGASDALIEALIKHGDTLAPAAAAAPAVADVVEPAAPVTTTLTPTPPADGVNLSFFYEALAPYGTWRSVDSAWVWQPYAMVVDSTWRPYVARGRWVNSDWGWAWNSNYSWGWAPFHYGRWSRNAAYGWVWTPDTVWGPAWVNWRTDDTCYGWAPLPPAAIYEPGLGFHLNLGPVSLGFDFGLGALDYCFVPREHFCDRTLPAYMLPHARVADLYRRTRIIENNYAYNNHRIINHGPSPERVQMPNGRPIKKVQIVDADLKPGQPLRGEKMLKDKISFFRPAVAPVATTTPQAILAKHELLKKQEARRPALAVLQDKRTDQRTGTSAQAIKFDQARPDIQAQQDKLTAQRKTDAAAAAAHQAQAKQELETKRLQAQRETQAPQEKLTAQRKADAAEAAAHQAQVKQQLETKRPQVQREAQAQQEKLTAQRKADAETARNAQPFSQSQSNRYISPGVPTHSLTPSASSTESTSFHREAAAQREPVAAPQRAESVERPQSRVQVQAPVRSQPQEQPRFQVQAPVRSQPQAQSHIQVQAPARSQMQAPPQAQDRSQDRQQQRDRRG